jgi:hypothetical protein
LIRLYNAFRMMTILLLLTLLVTPPPPDRPWILYSVHSVTLEKGERRSRDYNVRTVEQALKAFDGETRGTEMITCIASRYYNYCETQVWPE